MLFEFFISHKFHLKTFHFKSVKQQQHAAQHKKVREEERNFDGDQKLLRI
jgi:hypothetical protein